jgi:GNAT superfamily N-acetyltransferase
MHSEFQYRNINKDNADELKFVAEQDSRIPLQYDPSFPWNEDSITGRLNYFSKEIKDDDFFEVAVLENKVVGFHVVKKVPYAQDIFAGTIITLWTHPEFRGKGIATNLKLRAETWAKSQKLTYLLTNVHVKNPGMFSINKKLGFEVVQYSLRKPL